MHKDVQQHPRSCWEVSRTQQASWICDWGLLFCQTLTVEKRIHFKLKGITKIKLLEQDEKIELMVLVPNKLFSPPTNKNSSFQKEKTSFFYSKSGSGAGIPKSYWMSSSCFGVSVSQPLLSLHQPTLTHRCVLTRHHSRWALTDPEDECRGPDLKTSPAYYQSHLCVFQEKDRATLDLAMRFSLPPRLPNWLW